MITRWPRARPVTPAPVASTVPVTSQPFTWGSPSGGGERPRLTDVDRDANPEPDPEIVGELRLERAAIAERERRRRIDADQDVVESFEPPEDDLELVDVRVRPHQLFDAPGIDDHPANLLHVVEPPEHTALE